MVMASTTSDDVAKTFDALLGTTTSVEGDAPVQSLGMHTTVLPVRGGPGAAPSGRRRRFRQVRPLGQGGLGEVVLAVDEDIQRKVAIKRIREDAISVPMLLRFADEVRTIGQLEHPGIVPVHDVGVDEAGKHYLVMKYVDGDTLEVLIDRLRAGDPHTLGRYGFVERLDLIAKILEALAYAHERGFIHRDLKPANVMVGNHGEVTLMDWGIAKPIGAEDPADDLADTGAHQGRLVETAAGSILGTPLYMSPEQAAGKNAELDARTDVFAIGILIVELFTLHHPLEHLKNVAAIIATLLQHEFDGRGKLHDMFVDAGAPMDVLWFAARALKRDPDERYADAGEMLEELRRVRAGTAKPQCHVTATKRFLSALEHWIDHHPKAYTVLLGLAGLGLVTGVATSIWALLR